MPLKKAEQRGIEFASRLGGASLAELRTLDAESLLAATALPTPLWFNGTSDGYFLAGDPNTSFEAGEQAAVPLLVGWNSEEGNYQRFFGPEEPTAENFIGKVRALFKENAGEALRLYPATTTDEALQSATDLAGDTFIGYGTWKWADLHSKTGGQKVYRYLYTHPRPPMTPEMGNAVPGLAGGIVKGAAAEELEKTGNSLPKQAKGAVHSADIEYAMGNLKTNLVYEWTEEDYRISELFQEYYANFVKKADPNGPGLPHWPPINNTSPAPVMRLDTDAHSEPDGYEERYLFLDKFLH